MKLSELVKGLDIEFIKGNTDREIEDIVVDSRIACKGSMFVCIKGFVQDGHAYAQQAVDNGCEALLVSDDVDVTGDVAIVKTKDTRKSLPYLSDRLYNHPSGKLKLIGVTGTKGKTSTTFYIKSVFEKAGYRTGLIGTMYNMIGDEILYTERTTPEANDLQRLLNDMVARDIDMCVMEVSSQGLKLGRVAYCTYSSAVFTNLSRDHIGETEHPDMEDYALSKAKLFGMSEYSLINADSEYFDLMASNGRKVYSYGIEKDCDYKAVNIRRFSDHVEYDVVYRNHDGEKETRHVYISTPGTFSVYNSLAAIGTCHIEGIDMDTIVEGVRNVTVRGKAEVVPTNRDFTVIIDYAHNPDSFINILTTVKEFAKRCVFLFGAGGDRNRPRKLMGETAGKYADFTIITSDNPRTEDPEKIVRDIEEGIKPTGAEYICIVDRKEAIEYALRNALPGDVIILAGKGHETYQIFKDKVIHFDEREVVREILAKMDEEDKRCS